MRDSTLPGDRKRGEKCRRFEEKESVKYRKIRKAAQRKRGGNEGSSLALGDIGGGVK